MRILLPLLLLFPTLAHAGEPLCATSEANDARVRAVYERTRSRTRIAAHAEAAAPVAHDGAFYLRTDEELVPGYRPFDLDGQSLVFEPRAASTFVVRKEALRYITPSTQVRHDFQSDRSRIFIAYDVQGAAIPLFGQPVTRLYLTQFNGITLGEPSDLGAAQFDALEAAVHRTPVLSPLMITNRKPPRLHYPQLFVEETTDAVVITWRSESGEAFGYDVQAELRRDGSVVYSYRSTRAMKWGAPVLSAGFDPATATRRILGGADDAQSDVATGTAANLAPMTDIRRVEVQRIGETDLLVLRIRMRGSLAALLLADDQTLRFTLAIDNATAWLDVKRTSWTVTPFNAPRAIPAGGAARIAGDVVELYNMQLPPDVAATYSVRVWTQVLPATRTVDFATAVIPFDTAATRVASDLSALANGSELPLPITEPFVLGDFNPYAVWQRLQGAFSLSDYDVDAVAMYQSFHTDIVFYAGAYSTAGNPAVDGIAPPSLARGTKIARAPALLHMNQLTYGWNATEPNSSQVMLHELGHRWLYFFRILENGQLVRPLNPSSAHPAAFVHTPAAFRVFGDDEASVMGGAAYASQSDGAYRAHAANRGYSWTDLYLMGLATPEEVQPWFYIANSNPPQPLEYWPADGAMVRGDRRDVSIGQVIDAEGARSPSTATSQRLFRVLFVLVTDTATPTDAEVAKLNEWRTLLETTFSLATGGRGRLETEWVRAGKRRAAR